MKNDISPATLKLAVGAVAMYIAGILLEAQAYLFVLLTLLMVWLIINCLYPIKSLGLHKRSHAFLGLLLTVGAIIYASTEPKWLDSPVVPVPVAEKPVESGHIAYEEFYLEKHEMKYMPLLKESAPKVMQQAGCDKIDYATSSMHKGTKSNPVFYYTCTKNDIPSNIFLSLSELKSGAILPKPIDLMEGRQRCISYAKTQLNFPSTFSSGLFSWGTMDWPNGRRRIVMDFTAKNAFGMKLPASINCLFIPKTGGYELEAEVITRQ